MSCFGVEVKRLLVLSVLVIGTAVVGMTRDQNGNSQGQNGNNQGQNGNNQGQNGNVVAMPEGPPIELPCFIVGAGLLLFRRYRLHQKA
jgi:hypothetical protein